MKKILLALAVVFSMSSCGIYSKYDKTTAVDEKLYGEGVDAITQIVGADTANMMGNISWREIFTDAQLQALIEQALEQNTDIRKAVISVEDAQIALRTARLAYVPSFNLAPQTTVSGLIEDIPSHSQATYVVPLAASWEVDIFGRLRNDKLRAKMVAEQAEYVEQAVRTEIVAAVANLYYTISMLDGQIKVTRLTANSWAESVRTAKAMKEAGMMNEAGLSQIEAGLLGVENALASLLQARKESENAMCSILAMSPQQITVAPLREVTIPAEISLGVPMQIISARPDVMAAEAALAASFYSENMARSAMYPKITLSANLGWTNALGQAIVDPAEFVYQAVAGLVQPIFNRGLNRAQLQIAKSKFEQSQLDFSQTLLDAGIEVNNALAKLYYTNSQSANYDLQVKKLARAARSTKLLMENGHTTYLEVLTAQQSLFSAELQQVNNRYEKMSGLIALYNSLGGGRF